MQADWRFIQWFLHNDFERLMILFNYGLLTIDILTETIAPKLYRQEFFSAGVKDLEAHATGVFEWVSTAFNPDFEAST